MGNCSERINRYTRKHLRVQSRALVFVTASDRPIIIPCHAFPLTTMFARARFVYQCIVVIAVSLAVTGWGVLHALPSSHPIAMAFAYSQEPLIYTADVINTYPHDPDAFTQVRNETKRKNDRVEGESRRFYVSTVYIFCTQTVFLLGISVTAEAIWRISDLDGKGEKTSNS